MALLIDTHIWLWFAHGDKRLAHANKALLEKTAYGEVMVSAISVWEIVMLVHGGRLTLYQSPRAWMETSIAAMRIKIIPLNADIALESYALPGEFHGDPADCMIVATARRHGLKLMTQDKAILAYAKKGHVQVAK